MKKIFVGILIIALIFVSSGAFAVLSENNTVPNDDATNIIADDIKVNSDVSEQTPIQDNFNTVQSASFGVSEDVEKMIYIGKYAYYPQSEGVNDRFIQCVECGGFVAIGDVTNALPDAAMCHHFMGSLSSDYKDFSYSYDEAYQRWVDLGQDVRDDGIRAHIDNPPVLDYDSASDDMPLVDNTVYECI